MPIFNNLSSKIDGVIPIVTLTSICLLAFVGYAGYISYQSTARSGIQPLSPTVAQIDPAWWTDGPKWDNGPRRIEGYSVSKKNRVRVIFNQVNSEN